MARQLSQIWQGIPGTSYSNISRADYQPEYRVEFDREKLSLHGLNMQTVAT